jgi:hypothetical protein
LEQCPHSWPFLWSHAQLLLFCLLDAFDITSSFWLTKSTIVGVFMNAKPVAPANSNSGVGGEGGGGDGGRDDGAPNVLGGARKNSIMQMSSSFVLVGGSVNMSFTNHQLDLILLKQ